MKKLISSLFLCFALLEVHGQVNLVPNPSFEQGPSNSSAGWEVRIDANCSFTSQENGPNDWNVLDDSPDRLIEGNIFCDWDNSVAQSGLAFINLVYMEAAKATLLLPIEEDSIYEFSAYFKINTFSGLSNQPNRFYIKFSNTNDSIICPYTNQTNWLNFDTIFKANSNAYEIEIWVNEFAQTGVYIDNLSLKKINASSILDYELNLVKVFPNPVNDILQIESEKPLEKVAVYNSFGQIIFTKQNFPNDDYNLNLEQIDAGIYFVKIRTQSSEVVQKIAVN